MSLAVRDLLRIVGLAGAILGAGFAVLFEFGLFIGLGIARDFLGIVVSRNGGFVNMVGTGSPEIFRIPSAERVVTTMLIFKTQAIYQLCEDMDVSMRRWTR